MRWSAAGGNTNFFEVVAERGPHRRVDFALELSAAVIQVCSTEIRFWPSAITCVSGRVTCGRANWRLAVGVENTGGSSTPPVLPEIRATNRFAAKGPAANDNRVSSSGRDASGASIGSSSGGYGVVVVLVVVGTDSNFFASIEYTTA